MVSDFLRSSSQDGGVGRNTLLPRTTKRKVKKTILKQEQPERPENQTAWNLRTKEIKKHSPSLVGRAETGSWAERTRGKVVEQAAPHLHVDKPGGTTGEQDRPHNLGFQLGEIKPQTSD